MSNIFKQNQKTTMKLDKPAFILSLIIVLLVSVPLILVPDKATEIINVANTFVLKYFGSYYLAFGIGALAFVLYVSFTKYGSIILGGKDAKPEHKTLTWVAMNICAGTGSGIVLWGATEWIYYYTAPPLFVEAQTPLAGEMSIAYGMFHWGIIGQAIYVMGAAAVGYLIYVRKQNVLKLNEACSVVLKGQTHKTLGKLVNLSFIFGLIGASATTLGLSTPMVGACLGYVFGIEYSFTLEMIALLIVTAIFTTSVTLGMKKGIARLSNLNIILAFTLLGMVLVFGNTLFIGDTAVTSIGYMFNNFFRMATWLDPIGQSGFAQGWTVFYWAFFIAFAPFMAIFLAKISYGRTIRSMLCVSITGATIASVLHQTILGGHGLFLQTSGQFDVITSLAEQGQGATVVAILSTIPGGKFTIAILGVLCIIFLATQFDSAAYVLAAATQKNVGTDQDPAMWLRFFWAIMLFLLPLGFIMVGAPLDPLKTMCNVLALPLSFVMILTVVCFFKMVHEDKDKGIITFRKDWLEENIVTTEEVEAL